MTLHMFCHGVAAKHCLNFYDCRLVKLTDVTIDPPTCREGEKILNCAAESKAAVCFKIRNAERRRSRFSFSVSSGSGGRKNENQSIIYLVSRRPTSPQAKQNSWPESKQEGSVQIGKKKGTIETSLNTTWRLVFMRGFDFGRVGLIKSPAPPTLVFLVCSPLEVASPRLCPQHSTFCLPLTVNTEVT